MDHYSKRFDNQFYFLYVDNHKINNILDSHFLFHKLRKLNHFLNIWLHLIPLSNLLVHNIYYYNTNIFQLLEDKFLNIEYVKFATMNY
jgi:hypothetical protein